MKSKIPTCKKYLCIECGRVFIDASPNEFICDECKYQNKVGNDITKLLDELKGELTHGNEH